MASPDKAPPYCLKRQTACQEVSFVSFGSEAVEEDASDPDQRESGEDGEDAVRDVIQPCFRLRAYARDASFFAGLVAERWLLLSPAQEREESEADVAEAKEEEAEPELMQEAAFVPAPRRPEGKKSAGATTTSTMTEP